MGWEEGVLIIFLQKNELDISLDINLIKSTVKIAMLNFINRPQCNCICIKYCKKKNNEAFM